MTNTRLSSLPKGFFSGRTEESLRSQGSEYDPGRVCVVILARDEERTVAEAVRAALGYARDVIVIDGRSRDWSGCRRIRDLHAQRRGFGFLLSFLILSRFVSLVFSCRFRFWFFLALVAHYFSECQLRIKKQG